MNIRQQHAVNVNWVTVVIRCAALYLPILLGLQGCVGSSEQDSVDVRLGENPIAYVKRVTPRDEDDNTLLENDFAEPAAFFPGASLYVRDVASPNAPERNISAGLFTGQIDIKDLSPSYDGRRMLFAMRAPEIEDADDDEQPTWNIWEYDFDTASVRRIIPIDLIAEEGQDMAPRYLPDGRIVFVSTRQRQALARLLDEGKPQFSPLEEDRQNFSVGLHVMNADGSNIRQISFNMSHDLAPLVMSDGRVLMLRWDHKDNANEFNFYSTRPDGADTEIMYGADSHTQNDPAPIWAQPNLLSDGSVLVLRRPQESATWSGIPTILRVKEFINVNQPVAITGGSAQLPVLPLPVRADDQKSPGGRFAAITPLNDGSNRFLVAWSPCRLRSTGGELLACTDGNLNNDGLVEAEPAYGLWIFDGDAGTQLPVIAPKNDVMITSVAVMARRNAPMALADGEPGVDLNQFLFDQDAGVIDIRSVYDFSGVFNSLSQSTLPVGVTTLDQFKDPALVLADERRARFLRIVKGVLIPDDDVVELDAADFGRPQFGMREIVGYVPIAPDGSVRARVPANVPLDIQLVDKNGRNILTRHGAWITVRSGETLVCGGCHQANSALPHGRRDAELDNVNVGAVSTGAAFPNTRPALFADAGETMAQVLARVEPEVEIPSLDVIYEDIWTDPAVRTIDDPFTLAYADLDTPTPEAPQCAGGWNPLCRAVINYVEHIQPIWDAPRTVDDGGAMIDGTCSSCHNRRDDMNALRVPDAQLELTGDADGAVADNLVSYRELLFQDNVVALVDGALVDELTPVLDGNGNPVYEVDENGDLVLDALDMPIPVLETTTINPSLSAGNARVSRFFNVFSDTGAHPQWLTPAELRLLSEWTDIGAQNYNNPFAVPQ